MYVHERQPAAWLLHQHITSSLIFSHLLSSSLIFSYLNHRIILVITTAVVDIIVNVIVIVVATIATSFRVHEAEGLLPTALHRTQESSVYFEYQNISARRRKRCRPLPPCFQPSIRKEGTYSGYVCSTPCLQRLDITLDFGEIPTT